MSFEEKPKSGVGLVAIGEFQLKGAALETPFGEIVDMTTVGRTRNL